MEKEKLYKIYELLRSKEKSCSEFEGKCISGIPSFFSLIFQYYKLLQLRGEPFNKVLHAYPEIQTHRIKFKKLTFYEKQYMAFAWKIFLTEEQLHTNRTEKEIKKVFFTDVVNNLASIDEDDYKRRYFPLLKMREIYKEEYGEDFEGDIEKDFEEEFGEDFEEEYREVYGNFVEFCKEEKLDKEQYSKFYEIICELPLEDSRKIRESFSKWRFQEERNSFDKLQMSSLDSAMSELKNYLESPPSYDYIECLCQMLTDNFGDFLISNLNNGIQGSICIYLGIASCRANLDYRTIKNLCSKNNENENPVINRNVIKLNYQYLKEYKDNLEKAVKEYYTKKYMMENFIQKIKKSST